MTLRKSHIEADKIFLGTASFDLVYGRSRIYLRKTEAWRRVECPLAAYKSPNGFGDVPVKGPSPDCDIIPEIYITRLTVKAAWDRSAAVDGTDWQI